MSGMNRESEEMGQGIGRRAFCTIAAGVAAASVVGSTVGSAIAEEKKTESDEVDAGTVDAPDATEAPISPAVFVIDRLEAKPGDGPALLEEYLTFYVPRAEACYAELVATRVAPPCWLDTDSNTLEFTWKVAGIGGCWGIDSPLRADAEVVQWWRDLRDRVVSLDRSYFADPADLEVLCNV